MSPIHRISPAFRRAGSILPRLLPAALVSLIVAACGDTQVAGTSSGVDNPSLTVGFRDASGAALRVTGDLDVYSLDQNPAVDAEPLVTIKVRNAAFTNLTGEDFARLRAATKQGAVTLTKRAAAPAGARADGDSNSTGFNIVLKTQDRTGSLVLGLKYDSAARAFSRLGGAILTRLDVQPKPLLSYRARIARDSVHGEGGRVFIPGTPFLATLVDSSFVIEDMPEGIFPMRLLTEDGKVYPIGDSLDTREPARVYRPSGTPVGTVDTTGQRDSLPEFSVNAGANREAVLELTAFLEASVGGLDNSDPRLTCLWRQIAAEDDSAREGTLAPGEPHHDSLPPPKPGDAPKADIIAPASLRSEVRFPEEGVYHFEITCTLGLRRHADTVVFSVRKLPPPPHPRIIQPHPGDSLRLEHPYTIQWEMPDKSHVKVQVSPDSGITWIALAEHYAGQDGLPILAWTPSRALGASSRCLIRVTSDADSSLHAAMEGLFSLTP